MIGRHFRSGAFVTLLMVLAGAGVSNADADSAAGAEEAAADADAPSATGAEEAAPDADTDSAEGSEEAAPDAATDSPAGSEEATPDVETDGSEPLNPHNRADACLSCHDAGETADVPGQAKPSTPTCEGCHPDVDMHAVGQAPVKTRTPEGWPMEDGVVACATCHAEPSCDAERLQEAPWHRGGPYADEKQMCWQCHEHSDYERSDPHHPDARRDPQDASCVVCHASVPADGASAADSKLRLQEEGLCAFCHEEEQHSGAEVHMGAKVETLDSGAAALIALDGEGRIACWTCHEVHGDRAKAGPAKASKPAADGIRELLRAEEWSGLLPEDVVWPGATEDEEHPSLLALSARDALCSACHGDGP